MEGRRFRAGAVSFDDGGREGYAFTVVDVDATLLRLIRGAAPSGCRSVPATTDQQVQQYLSAPPASGFRLVDFETAEVVVLESAPPQYVLRVAGTVAYANMAVQLVPLVYIRQPEYWGIEVVGSLAGIGLPAEAPYEVSLTVTHFLGTAGIEVIGASRSQTVDVGVVAGGRA